MEFDASFPTHGEAFELMEQGEGLLDDAAELAQALDVRSALAGDHRHDPAAPQITPHGLRVVRLVTQDGLGPTPWPAGPPGDGRDAVYQVEGLGDVVDVGGSRDDVQRGALAVSDQMVLAARLPPVDRRRTGRGTPFFRADVGAIYARATPVEFADRMHLGEQQAVQLLEDPAFCQRSRRRQHVCPEPNPSSRGRSCQEMSWCRT